MGKCVFESAQPKVSKITIPYYIGRVKNRGEVEKRCPLLGWKEKMY